MDDCGIKLTLLFFLDCMFAAGNSEKTDWGFT